MYSIYTWNRKISMKIMTMNIYIYLYMHYNGVLWFSVCFLLSGRFYEIYDALRTLYNSIISEMLHHYTMIYMLMYCEIVGCWEYLNFNFKFNYTGMEM